MANELKHKAVGGTLTQAEYEALDGHIFNSQATGDLMIAISASQLSRLAKGTQGYPLIMGASLPQWGGAIAMGANKITGLGDPAAAQDAATRAYVLSRTGLYLPLAGGTMTGPLIIDDATYIQLGAIANYLRMIPWQEADVGGLVFRPGEGNRTCYMALAPSGNKEQSQISIFNAPYGPGTSDYSVFSMKVIGDTVHFIYEDAGSPATSINKVTLWNDWTTNDLIPIGDHVQNLGSSTLRYKRVRAYDHEIIQNLPADHRWSGLTAVMTAGTALTRTQAVYVGGDSKMEKALATGTATMPTIALATISISENAEGEFLMQGFFRDDTWNWTIGGLLYVSKDTAGALTQTAPISSGEQVQVVGVAITADIIHFNPSYNLEAIS